MSSEILKELELILEKNPIIHTATSEELASSTSHVEAMYRRHAYTHMSLGDIKVYEDRLKKLIKGQRSFVGAVTGDYGLGKTSTQIHLWNLCEENKIIAVPPFSWKTIDDIFIAVESWVLYILAKHNTDAVQEFKRLFNKFKTRSIDEEIDDLVQKGMSQEDAEAFLKDKINKGTFKLDRSMRELINLCEQVTPRLIEQGYKGFVVFTDELQETIQNLSPEKVFSYVFELADTIPNLDGSYGIMIGMPLNTKVHMQDVRSDILDRLSGQKMFIDLSEIYDDRFASELWGKYAETFKFAKFVNELVDERVMQSLGQLTDSKRKDLGNGPRSVISAFKAIIENYKNTKESYTVFHLMRDIQDENIMMGESSKLKTTLEEQLADLKGNEAEQQLMKLLCAFPEGCSEEVLEYYGMLEDEHIKVLSFWMGTYITEALGSGYKVLAMQSNSAVQTSYYERAIKNYVRYYEANSRQTWFKAVEAFNNILVEELFTENNKVCDWTCLFDQMSDRRIEFRNHASNPGLFVSDIGGTFSKLYDKFPNRHLHLTTLSSIVSKKTVPKNILINDNYIYTGHWVFDLDFDKRITNTLRFYKMEQDNSFYFFHFNMMRPIKETIYGISQQVPSRIITPTFLLGLLGMLVSNNQIPENEKREIEVVIRNIKEALVTAMLTEEMKAIVGLDIKCKSHGKQILYEIFEKMCEERFPQYDTLIKEKSWKKRLHLFETVLQSEKFSVGQKRGIEPLFKDYECQGNKKDAAQIFGFASIQPLNTLMMQYSSFMEVNDSGNIVLKLHPAEKLCFDMITNSEDYVIDENKKRCPAIEFGKTDSALRILGYTREEVTKIYELGRWRKIFYLHPGEMKLYFKPLSIEEWKVNLNGILNSILLRRDALLTKEYSAGNVNEMDLRAKINNLCNEQQFDELNDEMRKTFNYLNSLMVLFINRQIDTVEGKLSKSSLVVAELSDKLNLSSDISLVENAMYLDYHKKLLEDLAAVQNRYQEITAKKAGCPKSRMEEFNGENGPRLFLVKLQSITEISELWDDVKTDRKKLENEIERFLTWDMYFKDRQRISGLVTRLEQLGLTDLRAEIDKLDTELNEAWSKEVPNCEPWRLRLDSLQKKINERIKKARENFDNDKRCYQKWLTSMNIREILRAQFIEDNQTLAYESLRKEFDGNVSKQVKRWLDAVDTLIQKAYYMQDILEVKVDADIAALSGLSKRLFNCSSKLNIEDEKQLTSLTTVELDLGKIKHSLNNKGKKGELEEDEKKLLNLLENGNTTLEEAILKYSDVTNKLDLEEVLGLVVGLFKKNYLDIKINRR